MRKLGPLMEGAPIPVLEMFLVLYHDSFFSWLGMGPLTTACH